MKKYFRFTDDLYEYLKGMSEIDFKKSIEALSEYVFYDKESELSGASRLFFDYACKRLKLNRKSKERIINNNDDKNGWRYDFDAYKRELIDAYKSIVTDEYIRERQIYHHGLDIRATINKAIKDYWFTEAGWERKRRSKIKTIDWLRTFNNCLSLRMNQVYKVTPKVNYSI